MTWYFYQNIFNIFMLDILLFGLTLFFGKYWSVTCFKVSIPVTLASQDLFQLQNKINPEPNSFSREHNATLHLLWRTSTQNAVHSKDLPWLLKTPQCQTLVLRSHMLVLTAAPGPAWDQRVAHGNGHTVLCSFTPEPWGGPAAKNGLFGNTKTDYSEIPVPQQVNNEWCTLVF